LGDSAGNYPRNSKGKGPVSGITVLVGNGDNGTLGEGFGPSWRNSTSLGGGKKECGYIGESVTPGKGHAFKNQKKRRRPVNFLAAQRISFNTGEGMRGKIKIAQTEGGNHPSQKKRVKKKTGKEFTSSDKSGKRIISHLTT